ncbi:conserved Plasmodium membrane protein, unknown function [Plasmodium ovale curtisi]|uniref:Magnesium transporter n=1 Tax=Plasmodium ovale curtisi TaxID=864141 RepID=A0A1A8W0F8_PLAOA|nr:conserved Plasmodium membrane protein, unknown function [Plasmodium ovale curtisi]
MDNSWVYITGISLSIVVSIIEAVGNMIIKKSHLYYSKCEEEQIKTNKIERDNLKKENRDYRDETQYIGYFEEEKNGREKRKKRSYSFFNISIRSVQNCEDVHRKRKKEKKMNRTEYLLKRDNMDGCEKGDIHHENSRKKFNKKVHDPFGKLVPPTWENLQCSGNQSTRLGYPKKCGKLKENLSCASVHSAEGNSSNTCMKRGNYKCSHTDDCIVGRCHSSGHSSGHSSRSDRSDVVCAYCTNVLNKRTYRGECHRNENDRKCGGLKKPMQSSKNYNTNWKIKRVNEFNCTDIVGGKMFTHAYVISRGEKKYKNIIFPNVGKKCHKVKRFMFGREPFLRKRNSIKSWKRHHEKGSHEIITNNTEELRLQFFNEKDMRCKRMRREHTMVKTINKKKFQSKWGSRSFNVTKGNNAFYTYLSYSQLIRVTNDEISHFVHDKWLHRSPPSAGGNKTTKRLLSKRGIKSSDDNEEGKMGSTYERTGEGFTQIFSDKQTNGLAQRREKQSRCYFYVGIILTNIVAPVFNIFSNVFLPASMVGFVSVRLMSSLLLEKFVLRENQSPYLYAGIPFCTAGLILITVYSSNTSGVDDFENVFSLFLKVESVILMTCEVFLTYAIAAASVQYLHIVNIGEDITRERKGRKKINFFYFCSPLSSGIMGSLCSIFSKASLTGFMSIIIKGESKLSFISLLNYKIIILFTLAFLSSLTDIFYSPFLLKYYNLTHVVSLKTFGNIAFNSLNGMTVFAERPSSAYAWAWGFLLVLLGILLLSYENVIPHALRYCKSHFSRSTL